MSANAFRIISTPLGRLLLTANERGLTGIDFARAGHEWRLGSTWDEGSAVLEIAARQLSEYFSLGRKRFDVPLAPEGTEFQLQCWAALCQLAYGETVSYGELAKRIGHPRAVRAVGGANHDNPLPIIVPCHRVIGADGSLTGYGGGLEVKRALLVLEGAWPLTRGRAVGNEAETESSPQGSLFG